MAQGENQRAMAKMAWHAAHRAAHLARVGMASGSISGMKNERRNRVESRRARVAGISGRQ
jgi:hypothetical protein